MLMQKHSPNTNSNNNSTNNNNNNNKITETDDVNSNSSHSNGNFFPGRNPSLAGSECNDDKSNDAGSSGDESHEPDNTEQENQTSFIDSSNRDQFKLSAKKKKKKTVKVKFSGSQDDKAGIKLKIRRTNNFNQDENHVIVDGADQQRKRHLKTKRNKSVDNAENPGFKPKSQLEEVSNTVLSDDSLPQKRSRGDSEEETTISKISVGINTLAKGTEIDETILGPCQAGSKLTLESVVLMETQSGILIVSVQWRGKTLMGALMESERFQIGTLEKDSIYRREKFIGMNRRNTRRKSKNLFGKKKRKTATPPDPNDVGGTENEAGNSDVDNPYICDKENCHMKFSDFQGLRIHIYQNHRIVKDEPSIKEEPAVKIETSVIIKSEPSSMGNVYVPESLFPMFKHCKSSDIIRPEPPLSLGARSRPSPLPEVINTNQQSEERTSFSPAYSDISDANEAPVLENEAELKPPPSASQPPLNLSLCHNPSIHAANRLFSPTAPALQPEGLCSGPPLSNLRLSHDPKLSHIAKYRYPITKFDQDQQSIFSNGFMHNLSNNHKPQNGVLSLHSSSGPPLSTDSSTQNAVNSIQDLSINSSLNLISNKNSANPNKYSSHQSNNNHKTATNSSSITKPTSLHHQSRHHNAIHSSHHHSISNGFPSNQNSKYSSSVSSSNQSDNISSNHTPPNGVSLPHYPFLSFATSVNSQPSKFNIPTMTVLHQPKY